MRVIFTTNLDRYVGKLPTNINSGLCPIPRVGDSVYVEYGYRDGLISKGYPSKLEVKSIEYDYTDEIVLVHLHYSSIQLERLRLNKKEF